MANKLDIFGGTDWIDGDILYALDLVTAFNTTISIASNPSHAQNYFELLKQTGDVDNEDYLIADIFTAAAGAKSTIVTGSSSALYGSDSDSYSCLLSTWSGDTTYDPQSFTNPINAFDTSTSTNASYSDNSSSAVNYYLGKTFTSRYVEGVYINIGCKANQNLGGGYLNMYLETYDGSTWTVVDGVTNSIPSILTEKFFKGYFLLQDTIQGIRARFNVDTDASTNRYFYVYSLNQYFSTTTVDVETDTLIALDGTEKGLVIFDKSNKPTGTSINVDVSDGSTTLSSQAVRSYIDISSFTASNLSLDFNLVTTNTAVTPALYGYGVVIIK